MRKQAIFLALIAGLMTLSCVRVPFECVPRADCEVTSTLLAPGNYEIVFVATDGSKAGRRTTGKLALRVSSPDDVSPQTGETVAESVHHRLHGSVDFDFAKIGAPIIIGDGVEPAPNSTDPVYPGVLVTEGKGFIDLWVGTVLNLRNDVRTWVQWTDGTGIVLSVHCLTPIEFSGTWGPGGIVKDGSGYFCARRK